MMIDELSEKECSAILAHASMGRLGCALDNQPYVLPIYLAYEAGCVYVLSTFGQKIEWMRENPKVCVEVEEMGAEGEWASVIAMGRYEELNEPRFTEERERARELLRKRSGWWQVAFAERQARAGDHLTDPIFFRVQIASMTGLRGKKNE